MKVVWTKQAMEGWREVADYILQEFGSKAMQDFEERTNEAQEMVAFMPTIGSIEWNDTNDEVVYRYVIVNRRSKMLYFIENETIFIADFWDVRKNK